MNPHFKVRGREALVIDLSNELCMTDIFYRQKFNSVFVQSIAFKEVLEIILPYLINIAYDPDAYMGYREDQIKENILSQMSENYYCYLEDKLGDRDIGSLLSDDEYTYLTLLTDFISDKLTHIVLNNIRLGLSKNWDGVYADPTHIPWSYVLLPF